jgi:hypothetical protein
MSDIAIGYIINEKTEAKKDAIHVPVAPVRAAGLLRPGVHVGFIGEGDLVSNTSDYHIGIVDPFLINPVKQGEKFWLFLYPGAVSTLRHDWSHPKFTTEVNDPPPDEDHSCSGCYND